MPHFSILHGKDLIPSWLVQKMTENFHKADKRIKSGEGHYTLTDWYVCWLTLYKCERLEGNIPIWYLKLTGTFNTFQQKHYFFGKKLSYSVILYKRLKDCRIPHKNTQIWTFYSGWLETENAVSFLLTLHCYLSQRFSTTESHRVHTITFISYSVHTQMQTSCSVSNNKREII